MDDTNVMHNPERKAPIPENAQPVIFEINSNDWDGMLTIMDKYGDSEYPFFGHSEDGEDVVISVFHDKLVVVTYQNNGWVRKMIYDREGTVSEMYEGKWR